MVPFVMSSEKALPSRTNITLVPSDENAGASAYPFNVVSRRAGFPSIGATYKSTCSSGFAQSEKNASVFESGDQTMSSSWQCCSGLAAAVTRSLLLMSPGEAMRISTPSFVL